ncbi:MAG: ABC transporter substrate-binding protein [bacterium]
MRKSIAVLLLIVALCVLGIAPSLAEKYNEAPMLRELVRAGKLPPVEERLPKEPFVVGPGVLLPKEVVDFEIGQYGGTERLVHNVPGWEASAFIQCNEPILIAPGLETEPMRGNVVKDYKVTPDQKVFTFYMREGLKWSDGAPVTTEDVLFAYEDVLMNKDLTATLPAWLKSGARGDGEPMKLEVLDKYTFRISFASPYGGFPVQLAIAGWRGYTDLIKPKHFLKQFHTRYTPLEKLEPLIAKQGLAKGEWWSLFNQKDIVNWEVARKEAIGFPSLCPWVMVEETPTGTMIFERNPYYFKVDTAGNQLPYIDRLRSDLVADAQMAIMKMIAGEVDHSYEYGTLESLPLYKENEERGGFRTILYDMHRTMADMWLNMTHPDPVWRQVVRDVRFRKALTYAINREEIIEAAYFGFAEPAYSVPSKYDPQEANRLLDEMGLNKRDAEGWRLGPDGKRFTIPIEFAMHFKELGVTAEIVAEYWRAVGIETTVKVLESGLWSTRKSANDLKASVMWSSFPLWWNFVAFFQGDENVAPLWTLWHNTGGRDGEEPQGEMKRFYDLMSKVMVVSPQERPKVIEGYSRLLYDNVFWIPTVENADYAVLISKKMGNVAHKGYGIAAQFAGEQYFFRQ